jgi:hypothetical protein
VQVLLVSHCLSQPKALLKLSHSWEEKAGAASENRRVRSSTVFQGFSICRKSLPISSLG